MMPPWVRLTKSCTLLLLLYMTDLSSKAETRPRIEHVKPAMVRVWDGDTAPGTRFRVEHLRRPDNPRCRWVAARLDYVLCRHFVYLPATKESPMPLAPVDQKFLLWLSGDLTAAPPIVGCGPPFVTQYGQTSTIHLACN
jgi:hypothetical protein